jgi:hypothetical protein
MPLDAATITRRAARPKPKVAATPKSDAHVEARGELDRTLAGLLPRAKTARSRAVLAHWASSRAGSQSDAWRDETKKALIASGVLPDYTASPLPVGTVETIYSDPLVMLSVKVVQQASRLSVDAFVADLAAAGVKLSLLRRMRKRHTTDFAGAHIITALLTG